MLFDRFKAKIETLSSIRKYKKELLEYKKNMENFHPTKDQKAGMYGSSFIVLLSGLTDSFLYLRGEKEEMCAYKPLSSEDPADQEAIGLIRTSRDLQARVALLSEQLLVQQAVDLIGVYHNWESDKDKFDLPSLYECAMRAIREPEICLKADGSNVSEKTLEAYGKLKDTDYMEFALKELAEGYDKYDRYYCERDIVGPEDTLLDSTWALLQAFGEHTGYPDIHFFEKSIENGVFSTPGN